MAGTPTHPETYTVSVHGYARRPASAYLFIDYRGCAKSFAAEYKRTVKAGRAHWAVLGSFHNPSYWGSDGAGPDHACAYLLAKGTRTLLARRSVPFRIYPRH
jgi:hypothetical protein